MTADEPPRNSGRNVLCVLSARFLPYAKYALSSLYANSDERVALTLITDSAADKSALQSSLSALDTGTHPAWQVFDKADADERAAEFYRPYEAIRHFREGHPCWRKITDPPLFVAAGAEMVILDPDLYFPNRFSFEPTPARGIALMWQHTHCLLPDEVVMRAYAARVALAHHVDIGVAQLRNDLDLAHLENLLNQLGAPALPRSMHVEAIVWSALALRMGGGYLDPEHWHCWRNSHWKRAARKMGVSGERLLNVESFSTMKCFHGGGAAKWWIPGRVEGRRFDPPTRIELNRSLRPFEPLTREAYLRGQRLRNWASRLGYHRMLPS